MNIDNEKYKGFEIKSHYNKEDKTFYALSKIANSFNELGFDSDLKNFSHRFKTPQEAVQDVKNKIDIFLKTTPKTYKELAEAITNSLVWTEYEECHADEEVIKQLVSSFIKTLS